MSHILLRRQSYTTTHQRSPVTTHAVVHYYVSPISVFVIICCFSSPPARKVIVVQKSLDDRSSCYELSSELQDDLGSLGRRSRSYTDPPTDSLPLHGDQSEEGGPRNFIYSMGSDNKAMRRASKVLMYVVFELILIFPD